MATKTLMVIRPGQYGTRMLKAGDTLEVSGPDARLYTALGWAEKSKRKAKAIPTVEQVLAAEVVEEKPAKRRRRKKA